MIFAHQKKMLTTGCTGDSSMLAQSKKSFNRTFRFGKSDPWIVSGLICSACAVSGAAAAGPASKPNIVLIMTDDSGYADLGCYGGEIDTPNLDRLGRNGMRFRSFYTNARCSPTRASLLTGLAGGKVGFGAGQLGGWHKERKVPAYRGRLPYEIPTIPELLQPAGYRTLMVGKWHLGGSLMKTGMHCKEEWKQRHPGWELTQEEVDADFNALPPQRGFQEYFGFLAADADLFIVPDEAYEGRRRITESNNPYMHNNEPAKIKAGTVFDMRCFIDEPYRQKGHPLDGKTGLAWHSGDGMTDRAIDMIQRSVQDETPFFLYLAYQEPHTPLQAPAELVEKYRPRYADFSAVEQARFDGLVREGLIDPSTPFRRGELADMWRESVILHAAMMEKMDANIGRVIQTLETLGELDNTLIFYLSDNGARAEVAPLLNKPYRGAKALLWEGGQKVACIAHWPQKIKPGALTDTMGWVGDFLPTVLEVAGVSYPENFRGRQLDGPDGRSLLPALLGEEMGGPEFLLTSDQRQLAVIQKGRWKLLINPGWTDYPAVNKPDPARYELYDLSADPAETVNLADKNPEKVVELETVILRLQAEQGMMCYFELEKIDPDRTRF